MTVAKVCDFGTSKSIVSATTGSIGTFLYMVSYMTRVVLNYVES
jgi:hypothetical protein